MSWSSTEKTNYKKIYLNGKKIGNENSFSLKIIKYILGKYDSVIIGCYNSPVQMLAIITMRLFKIPYILSTDGELFIGEKGFKAKIKKFFLRGARKYLVAGEKARCTLEKIVPPECIETYYFSSLNKTELENHRKSKCKRSSKVLVVGQYFDYKGMDIMAQVSKKNKSIQYKFVGMGNRTELFVLEQQLERALNVEIIPFMDKKSLEEEYKTCAMLVLPSRQECWGLVINEAASYGTPIISTWGSGAAVEFLADHYDKYLANPGDIDDLYEKILHLFQNKNINEYSDYLLEKSQNYSIENNLTVHCKLCDIII